MDHIIINGLHLYFDRKERDAAELIKEACLQSVRTIQAYWGLRAPEDCRVYVLTSWPRCVFLGAPLPTQILLALTMPMWYAEFKKRWVYAGGWSQNYGRRQVVGIKVPRLIAQTPNSMGETIFNEGETVDDKLLSIVSHELTHAFSTHLQLPVWLQEGLAMVTSDRCLEKQTVRDDTLLRLKVSKHSPGSSEKINLREQSQEEIAMIYIRGYWLTRYLAETSYNLLLSFLQKRNLQEEVEKRIAREFGINQDEFWPQLEMRVVTHFEHELQITS